MSKKNFSVHDLFADTSETEQQNGCSASGQVVASSVTKKKGGRKPIGVSRTLRAFTIEDALWEDFLVYVNLCGSTQVNMVNDMIREKIQQNEEKITRYKALMGGARQ